MPKLIIYILFTSSFSSAQPLTPIILSHKKSVPEGYYFITPYSMGKIKKPKNIQLITNEKGDIIVYSNYEKGTDFKIHPIGKLSYFSNNHFFILNNKLELLDSITTVDDIEIDAHDFLMLPNGHYLLIGKEKEI